MERIGGQAACYHRGRQLAASAGRRLRSCSSSDPALRNVEDSSVSMDRPGRPWAPEDQKTMETMTLARKRDSKWMSETGRRTSRGPHSHLPLFGMVCALSMGLQMGFSLGKCPARRRPSWNTPRWCINKRVCANRRNRRAFRFQPLGSFMCATANLLYRKMYTILTGRVAGRLRNNTAQIPIRTI